VAVADLATGRAVGALSVYATEPCPWSAIEVAAVGADAGVVAELLQASMTLGARDAEAAELTQALTARSGWSRPRGRAGGDRGPGPGRGEPAAARPRGGSQRTVADVAREVVQDAQRDWTAVLVAERARRPPSTTSSAEPRRRWL
jgi:hypothetical protein